MNKKKIKRGPEARIRRGAGKPAQAHWGGFSPVQTWIPRLIEKRGKGRKRSKKMKTSSFQGWTKERRERFRS